MLSALAVEVRTRRLVLTPASIAALKNADTYDWILFTSKHGAEYFAEDLRKRHSAIPKRTKIGAVGPETANALKKLGFTVNLISARRTARDLASSLGATKNIRVLFPRSALAPQDVIDELRAHGARVRTVPLYTSDMRPLTSAERRSLRLGFYRKLIFKSPSGIHGLLNQLTKAECACVLKIPAECIGPTTAQSARAAGFKKVSTK